MADGALFGNPVSGGHPGDFDRRRHSPTARVATFVLLKLVGLVFRLRAGGDEGLGLDVTQHGEEAYTRGEGAILVLPGVEAPAWRRAVRAHD